MSKPSEETKPVEREATAQAQANDLLRRLNREVFSDSIDIYKLPHAVGLVMDFAQASADAALERAAQVAENAMLTPKQKLALRGQPDDPDEILFGIAGAIRALKGSR